MYRHHEGLLLIYLTSALFSLIFPYLNKHICISYREFEKKAVKVLDECHNTDPEKSALLIERKYPTWGNFTCLEMAAASHDRVTIK